MRERPEDFMTSNMPTRRTLALVVSAIACAASVAAQIPRQPTPGGADYYEIMELNARFCHALDSGADQGRMFANLFIPNGVYVDAAGQPTRGSDGLAGLALAYGKPEIASVRHFTINVRIEMVPGGARQWSYLLIAGPGPEGSPGMVTDGGQYWDELVKTPEGWRYQKRTLLSPGTPRPEASAFFAGLASGAAPMGRNPKPTAKPELTPLDRAQIYQLYAHYPYALDKALDNGEAFANLFTADGVMADADGSMISGRGKLAEFVWKRGLTDVDTYITNVMLEVTPEGVIGRAYVMNSLIPQLPASSTIYPVGMFVDQIVKTSEGWRFKHKTLVPPGAPRAAIMAAASTSGMGTKEAKAESRKNPGQELTADDYAEIQQLYGRYAHGYDSKVDNGVTYLSVYTKTGRFTDQFNRIVDGFDALDKTYAHSATGAPNPIGITHSTWNLSVDPAPWGAAGRSYTGGGRINAPGSNPSPGLLGEYLDMIVKTPEGWRYERRIFRQHFPRPPGRVGGPPPNAAMSAAPGTR